MSGPATTLISICTTEFEHFLKRWHVYIKIWIVSWYFSEKEFVVISNTIIRYPFPTDSLKLN